MWWNNRIAVMTNMEDVMEKIMEKMVGKIIEKMADEGRSMINLAELFIKEPSSLEFLLMIADEGNMTIEQISNEITGNLEIKEMLDKLKGFKVVDIKDDIVNITDRGQYIIMKLRAKMNNLCEDGGRLCDMNHFCVYDIANYEL